MKSDEFYELLGEIDEATVNSAETPPVKRKKRTWVYAFAGTAAACFALIVVTGVMKHSTSPQVQLNSSSIPVSNEIIEAQNMVLKEAEYPILTDSMTFDDIPDDYADGYRRFFADTVKTFLSDTDGSNAVYSPLSLYMALGMTAEISGGDTREQLLDLLSQKDINTLRSDTKSIWETSYLDDGMAKCVLANSLWTNSNNKYKKETVDRLAGNYYASVYSGDPCTTEYTDFLQNWLNEQTNGLLSGYIDSIKMEPNMLLTLASTVNFSSKWTTEFYEEDTKTDTFHSPNGDLQCDMMYKHEYGSEYCQGDNFSAIEMPMEEIGYMRIILPDEGVTPEELLNDDDLKDYLLTYSYNYKNCNYVEEEIYLPKFDISDSIDMIEGLEKLGVTDLFNHGKADLSPLIQNAEGAAIDRIEQDTRVMIDEHGCKASSLTVEVGCGAGMPDEKITFRADRPFVFEILGYHGMPLFIGIVNDPT